MSLAAIPTNFRTLLPSSMTPNSPIPHEEERDPLVKLLCHAENGLETLLDRAKDTAFSCKDILTFCRKRALIEEEYGRSLIKLATGNAEFVTRPDRKQLSYSQAIKSMLSIHESVGQHHLKLAAAINDIAEGLQSLLKDTDRARKSLREMGTKFDRGLLDTETAVEKARLKYDSSTEDWERLLLQRNSDTGVPSRKPGSNPLSRFKQRTPHNISKNEEEARTKAELANEQYKVQLAIANTARQEYFQTNMPLVLQALMEALEECDYGMQYFLAKYAYNVESIQLANATAISPTDGSGTGLRDSIDAIDNQSDLRNYVMDRQLSNTNTKRHDDIPYEEYLLSDEARMIVNPRPIFGIDLGTQLQRDRLELPIIVSKCIITIEKHGLTSEGIYRVSGPTSQLRQLKSAFDKDSEQVDLGDEELLYDINSVAGVLKLFLRELPDPLLTRQLSSEFIQAAAEGSIGRLRACLSRLPSANYTVLRCIVGHLSRIRDYEALNRMSANNIAIIFGPAITVGDDSLNPMMDTAQRCKVLEIMIVRRLALFDD